MPDPSRILLIRPSALGDVCRTVPCLVSLRRAFPGSRLDWLVQDAFAPAVAFHPALDSVIPFPRKSLGTSLARAEFRSAFGFVSALRRARYDLVVDLQGLARSGFFAWCTRATRRVGFANARELGWLGLNERHPVPTSLHTVDRMLELLRRAGVDPVPDMRLCPSADARARVQADPELVGRRFAVVAPTSRWAGKRWPAERFAALIPHVLDAGVDAVVLVGASSERDQCAPLRELATRVPDRVIDRIGATSVGDLLAIIERCALFIGNDSAALHMAVGCDRPLIALYGPTRINLVGPYQREGDVIQHVTPADLLDHKDTRSGLVLLNRITVDEVAQRLAPALARRCTTAPLIPAHV